MYKDSYNYEKKVSTDRSYADKNKIKAKQNYNQFKSSGNQQSEIHF